MSEFTTPPHMRFLCQKIKFYQISILQTLEIISKLLSINGREMGIHIMLIIHFCIISMAEKNLPLQANFCFHFNVFSFDA